MPGTRARPNGPVTSGPAALTSPHIEQDHPHGGSSGSGRVCRVRQPCVCQYFSIRVLLGNQTGNGCMSILAWSSEEENSINRIGLPHHAQVGTWHDQKQIRTTDYLLLIRARLFCRPGANHNLTSSHACLRPAVACCLLGCFSVQLLWYKQDSAVPNAMPIRISGRIGAYLAGTNQMLNVNTTVSTLGLVPGATDWKFFAN